MRDAAPPAITISVWQVVIGLRLTSVAARSQDSSAARYHSSSASLTASSGRPAISGSRPGMLSRITSAVEYRTWSERMCAASWPSTVRISRSSSAFTVPELSTTIGRCDPTAIALMNGIWAM